MHFLCERTSEIWIFISNGYIFRQFSAHGVRTYFLGWVGHVALKSRKRFKLPLLRNVTPLLAAGTSLFQATNLKREGKSKGAPPWSYMGSSPSSPATRLATATQNTKNETQMTILLSSPSAKKDKGRNRTLSEVNRICICSMHQRIPEGPIWRLPSDHGGGVRRNSDTGAHSCESIIAL